LRNALVLGCAAALMASAVITVHLRRQVIALGREIGGLDARLDELRRRNENLTLELEAARSPEALRARADALGLFGPREAAR
jgi:cell division protein FtsL